MASKRKLVMCPLCEATVALKPKLLVTRKKQSKVLEARNQCHGESNQIQLVIVKVLTNASKYKGQFFSFLSLLSLKCFTICLNVKLEACECSK